jgi:hypothetical protein
LSHPRKHIDENCSMPAFYLALSNGPPKAYWVLKWNDARFVLTAPGGRVVVDIETAQAHHLIDLSMTFVEGTITINAPSGELEFARSDDAADQLRILVDRGLQSDPMYRAAIRVQSRRMMHYGAIGSVVGTVLFGTFLCIANWLGEPSPDHWIHWFHPILKLGVTVILCIGLAGFGSLAVGIRRWLRIRSIERAIAARGGG